LQATTSTNWRIVTIQKYASQLTNAIEATPTLWTFSKSLGKVQNQKPGNKQHPSYFILVDILKTSREGTEAQEVFRERHAQAAVVRMH
jgi:hypothetical protein